ncbi:MAG TPA: PIG-L family deacetylase [Terriglobales bacterium]|nr:PIG-L family deacetylase [Terriglobales bacterium]
MKYFVAVSSLLLTFASMAFSETPKIRLEDLHDKTILVFTPHPDDDAFGAGGTIALLNRNHNKVFIVIYTNDDKGSGDREMTSQRLAIIRKHEEEVSEGLLGTPKENLIWMGYDDGMLEYAAQPKLTEEATAIIRKIRPDVLLSVDPGEWYERWHKTDHRMAAFNTIDAVRAAQFHLYFPNLLLERGLEPYHVPELYFFYPSDQEANYWVNIDSVFDLKAESLLKQVSQFEPSGSKYRPDWDPETYKTTKEEVKKMQDVKDGHPVEAFRYATSFQDR